MRTFFGLIVMNALTLSAQNPDEANLLKAVGHPMQYYLSLPKDWNAERQWPVVVAVEEAAKQFKANAERFRKARGEQPFILVSPIIVTNGRQGHKDPDVYPYAKETWDRIDREGICAFDEEGLQQVIRDVQENYNGAPKVFITGFEAGAHLVWTMVFRHPELLAAAVPVSGNYRGRCMEDGRFSEDPSRASLPVHGLRGSLDSAKLGNILYGQWLDARKTAESHGYKNISESLVPGKDHVPLPDEVLTYFYELWKKQ